jgi:hypothetical protein
LAFLRLAKVPYLTSDDIKWFVSGKTFIKTGHVDPYLAIPYHQKSVNLQYNTLVHWADRTPFRPSV